MRTKTIAGLAVIILALFAMLAVGITSTQADPASLVWDSGMTGSKRFVGPDDPLPGTEVMVVGNENGLCVFLNVYGAPPVLLFCFAPTADPNVGISEGPPRMRIRYIGGGESWIEIWDDEHGEWTTYGWLLPNP